MVFLRATLFSIFCLCFGGLLLAWQLGIISEKDLLAYQELASHSNLSINSKENPYSAKQERYKIVKEFYLEGDRKEKRLVRLKSKTSSLFYEQKAGGKEIVEKMSDVLCVMQEDAYALLSDGRKAYKQANGQFLVQNEICEPPFNLRQDIQRIRCSHAIYHYQTQVLDAENVIVERYSLPGEYLPNDFEQLEPFFLSTAKNAVFSFKNGITFNAQNLEAAFYK